MTELAPHLAQLNVVRHLLKNNGHLLPVEATTASASGGGYRLGVRDAYLPAEGEAVFTPDECILGLILKKHGEIYTCPFPGDNSELSAVQGLHFIPAQGSLLTRWSLGAYRSLFIEFDFEKLFKDTIHPPIWSGVELKACVNLKSPRIMMNMRNIAEELEAPGCYSQLKFDLYVHAIALELLDYFSDFSPLNSCERGRLSAIEIRRLHEYVDSMDGMPSPEQMATKCGVNTRTLGARYREATGMTLRSYISAMKIQKAQAQLLKPEIMVKQIAYQCGFASCAAFSRAFHKATGMTPLEYRRNFLGN